MDRLRRLSQHVARSPSPAEPRLIAATALSDELLEQTPVIIGVARVTPRVEITANRFPPSPTDHVEEMARQAARDTGLAEAAVLAAITGVAISSPPSRIFPNMSASLGDRLGCDLRQLYTHQRAMGGDAVQAVTNLMAERIAQGHEGIIACAHVMTTETQRQYYRQFPDCKAALQEAWFEDPGVGPPTETSGEANDGVMSHPELFHSFEEARHGLDQPIEIYPVIENALRQRYGVPFVKHQQKISQMMSDFSRVAAAQPEYAWIPEYRTPEQIAAPNAGVNNRWVGYPYTKFMNANDNIDGAASWLMCSVATAKRLGVPEDKWVYQHSGAHCHEGTDQWHVTHRPDMSHLPGMSRALEHCFSMAGRQLPDHSLRYLDLYSCFPCVVQIAADVLGMAHDDPRGFTVTGGLPFYGQFACSAGALVQMVELLRADTDAFGLVTGNGGYAQKHSAGLYSCQQPQRLFELPDLEELQESVNMLAVEPVQTAPEGRARVESFTVHHNRGNVPFRGVVIGRLEGSDERFVANVGNDPRVFARMMDEERGCIGATGTVVAGDPGAKQPNIFTFDA